MSWHGQSSLYVGQATNVVRNCRRGYTNAHDPGSLHVHGQT